MPKQKVSRTIFRTISGVLSIFAIGLLISTPANIDNAPNSDHANQTVSAELPELAVSVSSIDDWFAHSAQADRHAEVHSFLDLLPAETQDIGGVAGPIIALPASDATDNSADATLPSSNPYEIPSGAISDTIDIIAADAENVIATGTENSYVAQGEEIARTMGTVAVSETIAELQPLLNVAMDAELQHRIFDEVCGGDRMHFCLIMAIAEHESQFDANLIGDHGESFGIVQIYKKWHVERMEKLGVTDLFDPIQCMRVGLDYLDEIMVNLEITEPTHMLFMSYNMGPSGARNAYANGNYSSIYSRAVLPRYEEFMRELAV